ncbi:MAG: hypothetical protein HKL79_06400 [Thermoplasmata archaeon]|nr:hypothetical protein [Thermoplasmata archaeon]
MATERTMKQNGKRCALCGGALRRATLPYASRGVSFGEFEFDVCSDCGDTLVPKSTSLAIEKIAKERGLWGAGPGTIEPPVPHHRGAKVNA